MQNPMLQTIKALAKEKGIEAETIISAIEDAVLTASRKYYKTNENLKTRFNQETGQVDLFAIKHIVPEVTNPATQISLKEAQELYGEEAEVDMEIEFPKRTDVLGRIAAQTAKQVIFQKVREAERENIFGEYSQRIGEVVNATVKRFENGDMVVELGRIEASLPRKEQSRAESYSPGERLRAVIKGVNRELRGEKIDIVEWSDDPISLVTNALSPAKVQRVSIADDKDHVVEVVVEDKQLSLAIGKKGQNVRLAAKLTGWRIDIKSEEEKRKEVEAQLGALEAPG